MGQNEPVWPEQEGEERIGEKGKASEMTIEEFHNEYPGCAVCGSYETVVHHIQFKQMGGSKIRDKEWNWISLCNLHHRQAHRLEHLYLSKEFLFELKERIEKRKESEIVFGRVS